MPDPDDQRARLIAPADCPDRDRTELVRLIGRPTEDLTAQLDAVAPDGVPPKDGP